MGLFDIFKREKTNVEVRETNNTPQLNYLNFNSITSYRESTALNLSAVYRCVEVISDAIAQLPLECYKIDKDGFQERYTESDIYKLITKNPNKRQTRFTFVKTLVTSVLLKGNGYALIVRDEKNVPTELRFIPAEYVTPQITNYNEVVYAVTGLNGYVEAKDMIHILNFSYDGILGVSTLHHAKASLSLSSDSEAHAEGFFKGGANLAGVLTVQGQLDEKKATDMKDSWKRAFNPTSGEANGIAILQGNMDFKPITINPVDAQLLETRKFNVIDICRFFGVSPIKAMSLYTELVTPNGYVLMKDVKVGDTLFDRAGNKTTVIYKTDVFKGEDTYRLTFDDGTTATVGHDHNWIAIKTGRSHRGENIYTTSEMYEYIQKYGKGFRIPKNKCVDYSEKDLLIDPYLLGYWLGDGCHSNNHITCHKDDFYVLEEFGHNQIKEKGNTFDFGVPNLRKKLMNIGVLNNKHIPEIYKRGSKAQRLALI